MTTVANPGNIVVPLSTILDQLRGRLSSLEIDALLAGIVSRRKDEVHPGDPISADLLNQILQDLRGLHEQVADILAGGATNTANTRAGASFLDAWTFYGTMVKSSRFLPDDLSAEGVQSAIEITAYLQSVMSAAMAGSTLAYRGVPSTLLDAFLRIYRAQQEVVVLFSAPIAGVSDTSNHRQFATQLNAVLEVDSAQGAISLGNAIANADLYAAIAAQNRVNGIVGGQSGTTTTGNLQVVYGGAVGNTETLVLGSTTPVLYRFKVTNRTNRNLDDIQLTAEFLPPRQSWTQLSVVGIDGAPRSSLSLVPFSPSRPNDPAATQEVRIAAMTPTGAVAGDQGMLRLTAAVPEPINRKGAASRQVTVAANATTQTPGVVAFTATSPVVSGDLANATELTPVSLEFKFTFSALQGPQSRNFRFQLDISAPANADTFFFVEFAPSDVAIDAAASTGVKKVSQSFAMTDGATRTVVAVVTPLSNSRGKSLVFAASASSATDGVSITSPTITINVTN